jgi:hypothetical protein
MNDQHYRVSIGTYDFDLEELHHPAGAAKSACASGGRRWRSGADFVGALRDCTFIFDYWRRYHRTAAGAGIATIAVGCSCWRHYCSSSVA